MKTSIVISVYNEEQTIQDCLESLARQTVQPDEILIVDNNCTDRTIDIAERFNVVIIKETSQGIWAARNTGFNRASGDLIICTDADARFPADWVESILQTFTDPDVVASTGYGLFYDGSRLANFLGFYVYMLPYFFCVGLAIGTRPVFGSNYAMRRTVWNEIRSEVHSHTESVYDDIDVTYHLLGRGQILFNKSQNNYISIRPLRSLQGMIERYKKGLRSVLLHWPAQSPYTIYRDRILQYTRF